MTNETKMYASKLKCLWLSLILLLAVVSCIFLLINHENEKHFIVSVIGIIFFSIGFILFSIKIFDKNPVYIISNEGIYYYQFPKSKFLSWKHVENITETIIPKIKQKFICLNIKKENEEQSSVTQNFFDKGYRVEINGDIVKNYKYEEVKKIIEETYTRNKFNG
ncbi:MAG: STM3941 family protein [Alphaproteobacteria bacterium]